jgi:uncharacterized membrane protein
MHLDKTILIRASPDAVLRWLAPHRQPAWDPSVVRATAVHDGRFDKVARAFGHRFESHAEALAFGDDRFAWRQLEGDFEEHRGAFTLAPAPHGATWLHLVADVEFPYVMPEVVTEAEIQRKVSNEADEALLRLKELAEKGSAS